MHCVVKVGGSLLDWPECGPRLRQWLDDNAASETILVPGGGAAVELIRKLDRIHSLGDDIAHNLALRCMAMNAEVLAALVPDSCVIDGPDLAQLVWEQNRLPILDALSFCENDNSLPHTWDVTSDSIAARLAVVIEATELVLLKSQEPPVTHGGLNVTTWAECGYVDAWLPRVLDGVDIRVRAVNLRGE